VTAVEIDPTLARQLPKTIAERSHSEINRLAVLNRDILTLHRPDLAEQPTALVANLPYNVAVPALLHLLAEFPSIRRVMVMVQAEVAERLAAEPGGKDTACPAQVGSSATFGATAVILRQRRSQFRDASVFSDRLPAAPDRTSVGLIDGRSRSAVNVAQPFAGWAGSWRRSAAASRR
jgi:hypothetical protein